MTAPGGCRYGTGWLSGRGCSSIQAVVCLKSSPISSCETSVELAIIRQFNRDQPSAVDDQAIRLRATHQFVEGARIKRMKRAGPPLAIVPSCPAWMIA